MGRGTGLRCGSDGRIDGRARVDRRSGGIGGGAAGPATTVYLESREFDRVQHLLQTEAPLFFSALNLFGLRAFSLSTGTELPGEGPADDDALAQLATQARRHVADPEAAESDK